MLLSIALLTAAPLLQESPAWDHLSTDAAGTAPNGDCGSPRMSSDARYVVFESLATNLGSIDTNGTYDVYLRDRTLGTVELVSVASDETQGNGASRWPNVSADGRYVVFHSSATNLAAGDTNGLRDVFVRDRLLGLTERVSVATSGAQGNGESTPDAPDVSDDGRYVVFSTYATNLSALDGDTSSDVYWRDRTTAETLLVSISLSGGDNARGFHPSLSADGLLVAFHSNGPVTALSLGSWLQVYVRDMDALVSELVSVQHTLLAEGSGNSERPELSADGRYVVFQSAASDLDALDTNTSTDVFLRDRTLDATELVSLEEDGTIFDTFANTFSDPHCSDDGRYVVFASGASLVAGFTGAASFLRDRTAGTTELVEIPVAWEGHFDRGYGATVSADGGEILLGTTSVFVEGAGSSFLVFLRKRAAGQDGIYLTGPTAVGIGGSVTWSASHAPTSAPCWMLYGLSDSGLTLFGHRFDLGPGLKVLVSGTTTTSGTFTATAGPVPAGMSGVTAYVELAARESGVWHESNLLWLTIP